MQVYVCVNVKDNDAFGSNDDNDALGAIVLLWGCVFSSPRQLLIGRRPTFNVPEDIDENHARLKYKAECCKQHWISRCRVIEFSPYRVFAWVGQCETRQHEKANGRKR